MRTKTERELGESMRTKPVILSIAALLWLAAAMPLLAHHAFGGEFDPDRPILLKGKVVRVERRMEDGDTRMGVAAVIERYDIVRGEAARA